MEEVSFDSDGTFSALFHGSFLNIAWSNGTFRSSRSRGLNEQLQFAHRVRVCKLLLLCYCAF